MSFKKLLREIERQNKAAARENERQKKAAAREYEQQRKAAVRENEQQRKAAVRENERQHKEMEKRRAAAKKAAEEQQKSQRQSEVDNMNERLQQQENALETILEVGLAEPSRKEHILAEWTTAYAIPAKPAALPSPPKQSKFDARLPDPTVTEKLFGIGKTKRQNIANQLKEEYDNAVKAYKVAQQKYDAQLDARNGAIAEKAAAKAEILEKLKSKDRVAVERYFQSVLLLSNYPASFPEREVKLAYNPEVGELVIEYDLPTFDAIMPTLYVCTF